MQRSGPGQSGGPGPRRTPALALRGVVAYFKNFFAAFSTPPLFFFPPDFLPLPPEALLAAFLISFSIPAMLTAQPPFPASGWLSRSQGHGNRKAGGPKDPDPVGRGATRRRRRTPPPSARRRRRALTQAELAERAGVTTATVARIERAEIEPRMTTLRKLAQGLEVDPADLVGE